LRFLAQYEQFIDDNGFEMSELPDGNGGGGEGVFATHPSSAARYQLAMKTTRLGCAHTTTDRSEIFAGHSRRAFWIGGAVWRPTRHALRRREATVRAHTAAGWYVFGDADEVIAASPDIMPFCGFCRRRASRTNRLRDALKHFAGGTTARVDRLDCERCL